MTLIESLFDDRVGLALIDMDGNVLHTWPAIFSEIVPDPEQIGRDWLPRTDWEVFVHGSTLYPNGDVVFNFGGLTLVRMDACGEPLWQLPVGVHHAVEVADDGNIWTLGRRYYDERQPELPGMEPRFRDDPILEVSPDGEVVREISILGLLYRNDMVGMLFPTGHALEDGRMTDILHANDVEVLSAADAKAFPLFEAGDVMISLRNLNLVVVFDPQTERVKWFQTGPWLRQHDPDFMPDGRIVVFDNRNDGAGGRKLGGSRLLAIDPVDRRVSTIYGSRADEPFFTSGRGAVDVLDNGNFLLTESEFGRVFEITPDGEIVWSYVNRFDEERVVMVQAAQRFPKRYGDFATGSCAPTRTAGREPAAGDPERRARSGRLPARGISSAAGLRPGDPARAQGRPSHHLPSGL